MATTMSLEDAGAELADVLRGRESGPVRVIDVVVEVSEDRDGVPAVNLHVRLTDPPPPAETWRLEDLLPLRRDVRAHANEMGLESPVYIWFKPQSDPPQDDDV